MARHRLINCEFINAGSFKVNVSNKGKLLYLLMFTSADDRGFVDTTEDIINALDKNDTDFRNEINLALLENNYHSAIEELLDKGYLYEFIDNHKNKVHLIRHWFFHNKLVKGLWTNYFNFLELVHLENNEYILNSKKPLKENKENKLNQDKLNQDKLSELEEKPVQKESDELTQEDFPFPVDLKVLKGEKNETD